MRHFARRRYWLSFFILIVFVSISLGEDLSEKAKTNWSLRESIRTIIGFEQVGASSAQSVQKFFFNIYISAPLPFKFNKNFDDVIGPRYRTWGDIRMTSVPQQIQSSVKAFATEFGNKISELKVNEVAQAVEFKAGLEMLLGKLDQSEKTTYTFSLIAAAGATTPLKPTDTVGIFKVTPEMKALYPSYDFSGKDYAAFVKPERDRFYRQYSIGMRIKSYNRPTNNQTGTDLVYKSPAMVDLTLGLNDAATGGQMGLKNLVFQLDGFLPLVINDNINIFLYGSAVLKTSHTKISYPKVFELASAEVKFPASNVLQIDDPELNRDYYRIGIGIELYSLFKDLGKSKDPSK